MPQPPPATFDLDDTLERYTATGDEPYEYDGPSYRHHDTLSALALALLEERDAWLESRDL